MHVGDLLHTQPAELTGTHSAVHSVTAAIIGLHYVGTTARACFDLLRIYNRKHVRRIVEWLRLPQPKVQSHLLQALHWRRTTWRRRCRLRCGALADAAPGRTSGWGATAAGSGSRTLCHIPHGHSSAWDILHSRRLSLRSWGERKVQIKMTEWT